jgi:hypothetical protein
MDGEDTVLKRLPEGFEKGALELRPFIEKHNAMVGPRHVGRQRLLATTDEPHLEDRVVWSPHQTYRDEGHAHAGDAGNAMDTGSFDGLWKGHIRQDGGEAAG